MFEKKRHDAFHSLYLHTINAVQEQLNFIMKSDPDPESPPMDA